MLINSDFNFVVWRCFDVYVLFGGKVNRRCFGHNTITQIKKKRKPCGKSFLSNIADVECVSAIYQKWVGKSHLSRLTCADTPCAAVCESISDLVTNNIFAFDWRCQFTQWLSEESHADVRLKAKRRENQTLYDAVARMDWFAESWGRKNQKFGVCARKRMRNVCTSFCAVPFIN